MSDTDLLLEKHTKCHDRQKPEISWHQTFVLLLREREREGGGGGGGEISAGYFGYTFDSSIFL